MEISFTELKEKEVINLSDGKKLGRIIDIVFDTTSGEVKGIIVPGERKILRKNEDYFVPLSKLKRIGDDVILVSLSGKIFGQNGGCYSDNYSENKTKKVEFQNKYAQYRDTNVYKGQSQSKLSYLRYKPLSNKKYK